MSLREKWRFDLSPTFCGVMGVILTAFLHISAVGGYLSKKDGGRLFFNIVNYPLLAFIELYANFFKGGNTDQLLGPWLFFSFPLYWIFSSIAIGFILYIIADQLSEE